MFAIYGHQIYLWGLIFELPTLIQLLMFSSHAIEGTSQQIQQL